MTESDQQPLRQVSIAGVLASILSSTVTFCAEIVMHTIFKLSPLHLWLRLPNSIAQRVL